MKKTSSESKKIRNAVAGACVVIIGAIAFVLKEQIISFFGPKLNEADSKEQTKNINNISDSGTQRNNVVTQTFQEPASVTNDFGDKITTNNFPSKDKQKVTRSTNKIDTLPPVNVDNKGNLSMYQSGGTVIQNTYNTPPILPARKLTAAIGQELLTLLPSRDWIVEVGTFHGDEECENFTKEIQNFVESRGYNTTSMRVGMTLPERPKNGKLEVSADSSSKIFKIFVQKQ